MQPSAEQGLGMVGYQTWPHGRARLSQALERHRIHCTEGETEDGEVKWMQASPGQTHELLLHSLGPLTESP